MSLLLLALSLQQDYAERVLPLASKYCTGCHSTKDKKGDLDLERFKSIDDLRKDLRVWSHVAENLENGEMPPKKHPQPTPDERQVLISWVKAFLDAEARARAGDPGRVVVRRLSNAEYDNSIRDLTGVDLKPAREFPVDGAAGEGFSNSGDALVTSPNLLTKYLAAAKDVASHAVLLPDGFRFSPASTQRDWTDEAVAALQAFYAPYGKEGALPLKPYLLAAVRHRDGAAPDPRLSPVYFKALWDELHDPAATFPLDVVQARFRSAGEKDVDALVADIAARQKAVSSFLKIGSYAFGKDARQDPLSPPVVASQTLRYDLKPAPGQDEVTLHLSALELAGKGPLLWKRLRFENGPLLKDYASVAARYEVSFKGAFGQTARHLEAAAGGNGDGLNPEWRKRWAMLLGMNPAADPGAPGTLATAAPLELLDIQIPGAEKTPAIRGWRSKLGDLPCVLSNASDKTERIPGRASPHAVVVHPLPDRFVAVAWESPLDGPVRVEGKVSHAHGGCGNGVEWWIDFRRGDKAARVGQGVVNVGADTGLPARELKVAKGDWVVLAIDARDGSHVCDLTEIDLVVKSGERSWALAKEVADTILQSNPHGAWRFLHGPSQKGAASARGLQIPGDSLLGKWKAADAAARPELAKRVQDLLTGPRPKDEKHPDRKVYDALVSIDGPLFRDMELSALPRPEGRFGLEGIGEDLEVPADRITAIRLPAALLRDHAFLVDAAVPAGAERALQLSVSTSPGPRAFDAKAPVLAGPEAGKRLLAGLDAFRRVFPSFVCYPRVIPDDEVVCLKLYHREDEPLRRLFLDAAQAKKLDRLWEELTYISQWPSTEHKNLPLFIGFVTQDGTKEALAFFMSLREPFRLRAEAFEKEVEATREAHLSGLLRFASRAWRRPLAGDEGLRPLYAELRKKGMSHEEAFRNVLARILISPSFLFRVEAVQAGVDAHPVSDWELATRLSYFLWASTPDAELRDLAAAGTLKQPAVLVAQVDRMLKDPKIRGLATEFGAQWLHVRQFRGNKEKNEKLFPSFDDGLRDAMFEETVLFFEEFFRAGLPLEQLVDADFTHLNETLAKHYGIPGVKGPAWRRVDGVRKHGRGGIVTLGSVLTQQSGASRTSPVLRGNWVVETLLGEKLPKPPANVPQLPEEEGVDNLSVREMTLRHTRVPECATCHVRIDPFGFALEGYDAIGRRRDKAVDTAVTLRDGTTFDGLDGLRGFVLEKRRREFRLTFLRKLLGYALGRSTTLSDQSLLEQMDKEGGTAAEAVKRIVLSRPFLQHRGLEATRAE